MKLYAEQIQYLRRRKRELLDYMNSFASHCQNREIGGLDGFDFPHYFDFQVQAENAHHRSELGAIDLVLLHGDFQTERNFDFVDVGTVFYADFGNGDIERTMLVESLSTISGNQMFASTDSDFGKSVLGKKEGEQVSYKVAATGRNISVSIKAIDRIRDHYLHFIREKDYTDRVCAPAASEIKRLKKEDPVEYQRRHSLSPSQVELLKEELIHLKGRDLRRSNYIQKLLSSNTFEVPIGPTIQVGSMVEITLQDGDNEPTTHRFEFINHAVSTEIEGDYVERISTLGNAIYGLKEGDTFIVRRQHKPSIKGVVTSVQNCDVKERVR